MDRKQLVSTVCAGYCSFFKPGKDEALACKGFLVLQKLSTAWGEVSECHEKKLMRRETEEYLCTVLCPNCPFSLDGCDFAAWKKGEIPHMNREGVTPCGGFLYLGSCLDQGAIDIQALNGVI